MNYSIKNLGPNDEILEDVIVSTNQRVSTKKPIEGVVVRANKSALVEGDVYATKIIDALTISMGGIMKCYTRGSGITANGRQYSASLLVKELKNDLCL